MRSVVGRSWCPFAIVFAFLLVAMPYGWSKAKPAEGLQIYFVDVEGGQATLFVSPSGQSMLVDTGWPGFERRDAKRIVAAAKAAGLKKIDYVVITHYHADHVGGVPQLAKLIKIGTFVDHGPNLEDSDAARKDFSDYQEVVKRQKRMIVKAGDTVPIDGLKVDVLTAAGEHITAPLAAGGAENPLCSSEPEAPGDLTENARSVGVLVTYGAFRALDLGDLTKKKELELVCPKNLIGVVDLLVVSHHGWSQSNTRALVHAVHPRVAVMDNGAKKGGSPEAWQTVHDSPELQDLWQLHYSVEGAQEHNVADSFIANTDEGVNDKGRWIKVVAVWDGTLTVDNTRNGYQKIYRK